MPVGVLDAQDELATLAAGEDEVEQGHVGRADMGVAGRTRGNAGTDAHVGSIAVMPARNGARMHDQSGGRASRPAATGPRIGAGDHKGRPYDIRGASGGLVPSA